MGELQELQKAFTQHLRNPDQIPIPLGLDKRRMSIYSELIFNNVSALLSDFFPVIHSVLSDAQWQRMVRNFFISHQCQTPYFMKIAGEFVDYLANSQLVAGYPKFLPELAHYEWIELALFTSEEELPLANLPDEGLMERPLRISKLAVPLAYQFPVHRISPDMQLEATGREPTLLLVLRDVQENVRFFELQPLAFQMLSAIKQHPHLIPSIWLADRAEQLDVDDKSTFIENGSTMLISFNEHKIFFSE